MACSLEVSADAKKQELCFDGHTGEEPMGAWRVLSLDYYGTLVRVKVLNLDCRGFDDGVSLSESATEQLIQLVGTEENGAPRSGFFLADAQFCERANVGSSGTEGAPECTEITKFNSVSQISIERFTEL
jgi:hypothetical protein